MKEERFCASTTLLHKKKQIVIQPLHLTPCKLQTYLFYAMVQGQASNEILSGPCPLGIFPHLAIDRWQLQDRPKKRDAQTRLPGQTNTAEGVGTAVFESGENQKKCCTPFKKRQSNPCVNPFTLMFHAR